MCEWNLHGEEEGKEGKRKGLTSDSRGEEERGDELKRRSDEGHVAKWLVSLHFTKLQRVKHSKQTYQYIHT